MAYMHIDDELVPHLEILIDCIKLRGKDIEKQAQNIIGDTELMDQCLEDTFLQFKLHSKKVRDEYKKAVNEEIARSEAVWEKCNELIQDSRPTIENVKKDVKGLLDGKAPRVSCEVYMVSDRDLNTMLDSFTLTQGVDIPDFSDRDHIISGVF